MRIAVCGDGFDALISALACHSAEVGEVVLYGGPTVEPAPVVELPPNATKVLQALDLTHTLSDCLHRPIAEHEREAHTGYLLVQRPMGRFIADRYGAEHVTVSGADITRALSAALSARAIARHEATPRASDIDASLIVAADGPDSRFHAALGVALEQHQTAWRELVFSRPRGPERFPDNAITRWLAPGALLLQVPDRETLTSFAWLPRGETPAALAAHLTGSHLQSEQPVFDTAPIEQWHDERVVLAGSAAHPTLPFARTAPATVLEDAWVLARMLDNYDDHLPTALAEYARFRQPRTRRLQALARRLAKEASEVRRWQRRLRNTGRALKSRFLPEMMLEADDWLYGYDCIRGFR